MNNILIFGSCVSRDILRLNPNRFSTTHYIARQSLISAYSPPIEMPNSMHFESRFLQRSIQGDFNSDAMRRIRFHAGEVDQLLIDLATERRGYLPIRNHALLPTTNQGAVVSFSQEVANSKISNLLPTGKRVKFGSRKHFTRFTKSALRFKNDLQNLDLFDRTTIIRTPFVDKSNSHLAVPIVHRLPGKRWNELFCPYYEILEELGFKVTPPLPEEYAVADTNHKWGIGSNHYIPEAYEWWANYIAT